MGRRSRRTGEPERTGPADGRHQGHVRQEAGDDEENELHHGPRPSPVGSLDRPGILRIVLDIRYPDNLVPPISGAILPLLLFIIYFKCNLCNKVRGNFVSRRFFFLKFSQIKTIKKKKPLKNPKKKKKKKKKKKS